LFNGTKSRNHREADMPNSAPISDHTSTRQTDPLQVLALLRGWLSERVEPGAIRWLEHARDVLLDGAPDRVFFAAYGDAPRHVGDDPLRLSNADRQQAPPHAGAGTPASGPRRRRRAPSCC
jgi:hypothetical protein